MRYFQAQGKTVAGMKPVASGGEFIAGQWRNQDALLLQEHASIWLDYDLINPYAFQLPVSPHLAAENNPVQLDKIVSVFERLKQKADMVLVEGVGGWLVPLNNQGDDVAELVKRLQLPVIMVVAIRLGCINHARLTYQAINNSGLNCAGWLAVCIDPNMLKQKENINTLEQLIATPLLGILPYLTKPDFDYLAKKIDFK
jgi:dethiobiotin synthetase